ncbi:MAG: hypothetical protein ABIE36_02055 [Candidatus Diapherotrites archaeon]
MAPIIEVSNESLNAFNQLGLKYKLRKDLENGSLKNSNRFLHVPELNLYFAGERTLQGKNWYETHKELQSNGQRMPTIPEFIEFLKYAKVNSPELYKEITEVRSPWRANWLDADFKVKGKDLYINYNHVLNANGSLVPKNSEVLDKNTLMKDKTPGISLDDYILENHTSQGLPNKKVKSGDLYYWNPRSDNNSVAGFLAYSDGAVLCYDGGPSARVSGLGVFAVKRE